MSWYTKRQVAVLAYTAGLLTGMIVGFAACTPQEHHPVTEIGYVFR